MQRLLKAVLVIGLILGAIARVRAGGPDPASAVIDKAVQAHGGLENLLKTQKMSRQATGVMSFYGQEVPFTDEIVLELPKRSRWTLEGGPAGQKTRFMIVYDGQKAWQSAAGNVVEVGKDGIQKIRDELYVSWI